MSERPNHPHIKLQDRLVANSLSAGSAIASLLPERFNFTVNREAPSSIILRWRHVGFPAEATPAAWVRYAGDETAGLLPRNFNLAAIILIDREEMDKQLDAINVSPAIAYKLGSTIMMGHSSKYQLLGLEHPDDQDYKVAMGIGPVPLQANAGVVFRDVHQYHDRYLYDPLLTGVRPGPVMPISEVPILIPYI